MSEGQDIARTRCSWQSPALCTILSKHGATGCCAAGYSTTPITNPRNACHAYPPTDTHPAPMHAPAPTHLGTVIWMRCTRVLACITRLSQSAWPVELHPICGVSRGGGGASEGMSGSGARGRWRALPGAQDKPGSPLTFHHRLATLQV